MTGKLFAEQTGRTLKRRLVCVLLNDGHTASPIATINGQPVLEYYRKFSVMKTLGYLEAHADWGNLMYSPVADIEHSRLVKGGTRWSEIMFVPDKWHDLPALLTLTLIS